MTGIVFIVMIDSVTQRIFIIIHAVHLPMQYVQFLFTDMFIDFHYYFNQEYPTAMNSEHTMKYSVHNQK